MEIRHSILFPLQKAAINSLSCLITEKKAHKLMGAAGVVIYLMLVRVSKGFTNDMYINKIYNYQSIS